MALPAIGTTNVGLRSVGSAIGESCGVQQSSNISLASLSTGGSFNGIQHTFAASGGPVMDMSNVSLTVEIAPYKVSECLGGVHSTGGGGSGGGGGGGGLPRP
tara:strand:- start:159 stop:464 length:306 start_codon:yes stop_codon:yes gene_type:complete